MCIRDRYWYDTYVVMSRDCAPCNLALYLRNYTLGKDAEQREYSYVVLNQYLKVVVTKETVTKCNSYKYRLVVTLTLKPVFYSSPLFSHTSTQLEVSWDAYLHFIKYVVMLQLALLKNRILPYYIIKQIIMLLNNLTIMII